MRKMYSDGMPRGSLTPSDGGSTIAQVLLKDGTPNLQERIYPGEFRNFLDCNALQRCCEISPRRIESLKVTESANLVFTADTKRLSDKESIVESLF